MANVVHSERFEVSHRVDVHEFERVLRWRRVLGLDDGISWIIEKFDCS
jgi:hypothetical protein